MRNTLFILFFALLVFAGCKPKSQSSLEIKTTDSTKHNGLKMPDVGDLKNNNTTASNNVNTSTWSKEYRNKFLQGCIGKASEKVSATEAFSYCNCMTEKVEAKYPNETEVDSKLTDADIESMKPGCLTSSTQSNSNNNQSNSNNSYNNSNSNGGQSWSVSDQQEFMNNCTPGASKTLGTSGATDYCDCMMKKLMQEYPDSKDVGNVSKTHMTELANDCLKK